MWRCASLLPVCLLVVLGSVLKDVQAKIAPYIWCGACIGLIEDMKIQISTVAKNKKLEVGSFRIQADGTQEKKEVPYASSDLFLTDQLERICSSMHMYVETTHEKTGEKIIIRKAASDGSSVSLKRVKSSDELTRSLLYSCQTIIEDNEDDLLAIFKTYNAKQNSIVRDVCVNLTGLCTKEHVSACISATESAIMAGIQEKADQRLAESQDQEALDRELAELDLIQHLDIKDDTVVSTEENPSGGKDAKDEF